MSRTPFAAPTAFTRIYPANIPFKHSTCAWQMMSDASFFDVVSSCIFCKMICVPRHTCPFDDRTNGKLSNVVTSANSLYFFIFSLNLKAACLRPDATLTSPAYIFDPTKSKKSGPPLKFPGRFRSRGFTSHARLWYLNVLAST